MKKYGTKFFTRTAIAAVILVALLNTGCPNAAEKPLLPSPTPKNYKTISAVHDVYNTFYEKGYNGGTKGPILVTKGVLKTNTETQDVYLVWLSGTEDVEGQDTNVTSTDKNAYGDRSTNYLRSVLRTI